MAEDEPSLDFQNCSVCEAALSMIHVLECAFWYGQPFTIAMICHNYVYFRSG